jgi:hypothetical protein
MADLRFIVVGTGAGGEPVGEACSGEQRGPQAELRGVVVGTGARGKPVGEACRRERRGPPAELRGKVVGIGTRGEPVGGQRVLNDAIMVRPGLSGNRSARQTC